MADEEKLCGNCEERVVVKVRLIALEERRVEGKPELTIVKGDAVLEGYFCEDCSILMREEEVIVR